MPDFGRQSWTGVSGQPPASQTPPASDCSSARGTPLPDGPPDWLRRHRFCQSIDNPPFCPHRGRETWVCADLTHCPFLARLGAKTGALTRLSDLLARGHHCIFAAKTPNLMVVETNPNDDSFIECAVATKGPSLPARPCRRGGTYFDVTMITPRQLLDVFEAGRPKT